MHPPNLSARPPERLPERPFHRTISAKERDLAIDWGKMLSLAGLQHC